MHAAEVLRKEVFAIEVVVVDGVFIIRIDGGGAQIAAPEAKLDMLRRHVALPLILGGEG